MIYRLWQAACVAVPLLVLSVPTLYVASIWLTSGRLGGIATVLLIASLAATPALALWTSEGRPTRPLPRKVRRQLADERARIALEKAIRDMEREAGL